MLWTRSAGRRAPSAALQHERPAAAAHASQRANGNVALGGQRAQDEAVRWVFGAAARAASGADSAADAAAEALVGRGGSREQLMAAAVRSAVAASPCVELAPLRRDEREPLALACIVGMDVDGIAATLGCERAEVKARLRAGLEQLSAHARASPYVAGASTRIAGVARAARAPVSTSPGG